MSDEPTGALPTPTEPTAPLPRNDRRWKVAAITAGVLVVALVIALIVRGNGGSSNKTAVNGGGSVTSVGAGSSTTGSTAANATQGPSGVVQVNGGGQTGVTKPPLTDDNTTTTTPTSDTTTSTTTTATTGTGGGIHPPPHLTFPTFVIAQPPPPSKLDYQASAKYGELNLSNGFSPDPESVGMTDGGAVDTSYLGGSCRGFASVAPSLRINFGGGGSSLLRLYFIAASGNPAIVINDPYGNFYCVDDSFGTVNPTIDFNNPAGGTYDVWVASPTAGQSISGTFFTTENSGNHP